MRSAGGIGILLCLPALLLTSEVRAGDPAMEQRSALTRDLASMAAAAQRHFYAPAHRCGGNGAFDNSAGGCGIVEIRQLTRRPNTTVGWFMLGTVAATYVELFGEGTARGTDGAPVQVQCRAFCDSIAISYVN